jgi:hypothetical protein
MRSEEAEWRGIEGVGEGASWERVCRVEEELIVQYYNARYVGLHFSGIRFLLGLCSKPGLD